MNTSHLRAWAAGADQSMALRLYVAMIIVGVIAFITYVVVLNGMAWWDQRAEAREERFAVLRALQRITIAGWQADQEIDEIVREMSE